MSSEILFVSEKTRRRFLQQKITYRDPSRVGSSPEKFSVTPSSKPFSIIGDSLFNDTNTSLSNFPKTLSKSGQIEYTSNNAQATSRKSLPNFTKKVSLLTLTHSNHTNCSKQPGFLSVCSLENEVVKTSSF